MTLGRSTYLMLALVALPAPAQQAAIPNSETTTSTVQPDAATIPEKPMHVGQNNIQKPTVIFQPSPQFSEEAKRAKYSGHVLVYLWVDKNGNPEHVSVVKGAGMGLDEKAVEAVRQYKFVHATFKGKPVTVDLYVNVNFQFTNSPPPEE